MPALRQALAEAVVDRLAAALPATPRARARRAEVEAEERPCLSIVVGAMRADTNASQGEVLWTAEVMVTGYPAGEASDEAAENAMSDLEASIVTALDGQPLARPGGGELTTGLMVLASEPRLYSAEESGKPLGDVTVTFQAQVLMPWGVMTF